MLKENHIGTGKTKHLSYGKEVGRPHSLEIAKYEDDKGVYLFHIDEQGKELTDTYHDDIHDAMQQAKWEYGVKKSEWYDISLS